MLSYSKIMIKYKIRSRKGNTQTLPSFPEFKKLEMHDKPLIQMFSKRFEQSSDYNFVSLWSYDTNNDVMISDLYGNLVVRFRDYLSNEPFYSFLGDKKVKGTIETLLSKSSVDGSGNELKLIPESNIKSKKKLFNIFNIKEDRANFDYILSIDDLCSLKGNKYSKFRKYLSLYQRKNSHHRVEVLNLKSRKIQRQIISLFYEWQKSKGRSNVQTASELKAIKRILIAPEYLKLFSLGVLESSTLISFVICDLEVRQSAETHFFKTSRDQDGAYHFLRHRLAIELKKRKYKYINIEQDLGIPGLRYAKEQLNPVKYLKKYIIAPR